MIALSCPPGYPRADHGSRVSVARRRCLLYSRGAARTPFKQTARAACFAPPARKSCPILAGILLLQVHLPHALDQCRQDPPRLPVASTLRLHDGHARPVSAAHEAVEVRKRRPASAAKVPFDSARSLQPRWPLGQPRVPPVDVPHDVLAPYALRRRLRDRLPSGGPGLERGRAARRERHTERGAEAR